MRIVSRWRAKVRESSEGFGKDIGPIVIGGHVDDMNLALVIQLAHLAELAIDVP